MIALKVTDIDSKRMTLRVEQGQVAAVRNAVNSRPKATLSEQTAARRASRLTGTS